MAGPMPLIDGEARGLERLRAGLAAAGRRPRRLDGRCGRSSARRPARRRSVTPAARARFAWRSALSPRPRLLRWPCAGRAARPQPPRPLRPPAASFVRSSSPSSSWAARRHQRSACTTSSYVLRPPARGGRRQVARIGRPAQRDDVLALAVGRQAQDVRRQVEVLHRDGAGADAHGPGGQDDVLRRPAQVPEHGAGVVRIGRRHDEGDGARPRWAGAWRRWSRPTDAAATPGRGW